MRTTLATTTLILTLLVATGVASADPVLYLKDMDTGFEVMVADNGAGDVAAPLGVVTYSGSLGGGSVWIVNVTTGVGNEILSGQRMDLNSIHVSGSGAGELQVGFSETGFKYATNPVTIRSEIGGTTDGQVSVAWGADVDNLLWSGAASPDAFVPNETTDAFGPGPFSGTNDFWGNYAPGPFSISQMVTVKHTGAGQITSFDSQISAVPEPGTLALLGVALVGAAVLNRRRRNNG